MTAVDREALLDVAKRAAYDAWRADNDMPPVSDSEWSQARLIGGQSDVYAEPVARAILPLIAEAIDQTPTPGAPTGLHSGSFGAGFILAKLGAVAYIRSSLGDTDGDR